MEQLHIISLGAGVQSTTMYLMACLGELEPMPNAAIFADTQWEPAHVYEHLDWLDRNFGHIIPINRVTAGNIKSTALGIDVARTVGALVTLPMYIHNRDGSIGIKRRQCTSKFKIEPILKKEREMLGLRKGQRVPKEWTNGLVQWIGISLDEATRMKPSKEHWKKHFYPLVERRMTRHSCILWLQSHGFPVPQKSACKGCPFHDNATWRRMRDESPDDWQEVVQFDKAMRHHERMRNPAYLHRSGRPLDEVDLSTPQEKGQQEFNFDMECEGMCGV